MGLYVKSTKKMDMSKIVISDSFAKTVPRKEKMDACRDHWNKYHTQDRDIVLNKHDMLIDGYVQYLVLKENNIKKAVVKKPFIITKHKNNKTTYVFGVHPNDSSKKEYVWRVPKTWTYFKKNVRPGDRISCDTVRGAQPVIVTRVKFLSAPPVNIKIRMVKDRKILRGQPPIP